MFLLEKHKEFLVRKIFDIYININKKNFYKYNLDSMLKHCNESIDIYKGKGIKLNKYDFIEKDFVNDNRNRMIKKGFMPKNKAYTGGTTGTPREFLRDFHSMAYEQYAQSEYFKWNGMYKVVMRGGRFIKPGQKKIHIDMPMIKSIYVSSFNISNEGLGYLVNDILKKENLCLWGFPTSIYLLAKYCKENNIKLDFNVIGTSSERLLDYQREFIEEVFEKKIKDWYGQSERIAAFQRCKEGNYHPVNNYAHIEFKKIEEGKYEVIGTGLHNKVMPLIRYKTSDIVSIADKQCECGNKDICIDKIYGRNADFIKLPNGYASSLAVVDILKHTKNIKEGQFVQKSSGKIIIRIVKEESFDSTDEKLLINTACEIFERDYFEIEYVDSIKRTKSGKFQIFVKE